MDAMCKKIFEWNSSKGPWLGGEFKRRNEEGVQMFFRQACPGMPVFEKYREYMCWDMGISYDADPSVLIHKIVDLDCWEWVGPYAPASVTSINPC
jgi:hypothetical protein